MGSWISADRELVAVAKGVLDIVLVARVLDRAEPFRAFDPGYGGVDEAGSGVRLGDLIADLPEFVWCEATVRATRGQTEMGSDAVGQVSGAIVYRPVIGVTESSACVRLDMRVGRVAGELDIDEEAVSSEELGCGVEGVIDRGFGVGDEALEVSGGDIVALVEVDSHCEERYVFAGREAVSADFVGRAAGVG
ncbi:hypothetical protein [Nocardia cyriacigeorgica]|uniref:hypothetical protein n=1 Tax=Nocardia cyriacigeorgica TaxID=135487 RepID=UPI000561E63B|nr:hypothetical protein [Nocardia cyriacigeorgica]